MIDPYTSLYTWPDGETYTCFVFIDAKNAKTYQISATLAKSIYPDFSVHAAVRRIAINRFNKDED